MDGFLSKGIFQVKVGGAKAVKRRLILMVLSLFSTVLSKFECPRLFQPL